MNFHVVGYYLIQGLVKESWMDKDGLLPERIWSGSNHICPKFPDAWIFDWVNDRGSIEDRKYAKTQMNLSKDGYFAAQRDFDELFGNEQFGFPNVFMDSSIAVEKCYQYFGRVSNLKTLGLGLPETYFERFMVHYSPDFGEPIRRNGAYMKLSQKETYHGHYPVIGYDLLGFDGADFCSFVCGSMESEMFEKYGVRFNQLGLISEYEYAERVSQAITNGEQIVEDGFWAPWLVFEIPT
jgi:hypothetical protein